VLETVVDDESGGQRHAPPISLIAFVQRRIFRSSFSDLIVLCLSEVLGMMMMVVRLAGAWWLFVVYYD